MFRETIQEIDHEIEWINYELRRQRTTQNQEDRLKAKRTKLLKIKDALVEYRQTDSLKRSESINAPIV